MPLEHLERLNDFWINRCNQNCNVKASCSPKSLYIRVGTSSAEDLVTQTNLSFFPLSTSAQVLKTHPFSTLTAAQGRSLYKWNIDVKPPNVSTQVTTSYLHFDIAGPLGTHFFDKKSLQTNHSNRVGPNTNIWIFGSTPSSPPCSPQIPVCSIEKRGRFNTFIYTATQT